jgi:predicted neuraminidase
MTLALSDDAGLTWPMRRNIEVGDGYCLSNNSRDGSNREYSYPSITEGDGVLHVAFTRFRQAIEYVELTDEWFARGAP